MIDWPKVFMLALLLAASVATWIIILNAAGC